MIETCRIRFVHQFISISHKFWIRRTEGRWTFLFIFSLKFRKIRACAKYVWDVNDPSLNLSLNDFPLSGIPCSLPDISLFIYAFYYAKAFGCIVVAYLGSKAFERVSTSRQKWFFFHFSYLYNAEEMYEQKSTSNERV